MLFTARHVGLIMLSLSIVVSCMISHSLIAGGGNLIQAQGHRLPASVLHGRSLSGLTNSKPLLCPEVSKSSEFAIVSILTCAYDQSSFDNYQISAMKLGTSIQMTHSNSGSDMILLLAGCHGKMQELRSDHLERAGWQMCFVPLIHGPSSVPINTNNFLMTGLFSKFHAWLLDEYDAVFLIDSDTLVLRSISEAISRMNRRMEIEGKSLAAVMQYKIPCSRIECLFTSLERCHAVDDPEIGFNAGVLLIKPSKGRFKSLLRGIDAVDYDVSWAEQGLLNKWYPKGSYLEMDAGFNVLTYQNPCGSLRWSHLLENSSIVHFTNPKPWNCNWYGLTDAIAYNSFDTCKMWKDAPSFIH